MSPMPDKLNKNKVFSDDNDVVPTDDEGFVSGAESSFSGKLKDLKDELKKCSAERAEYLAGWQRAKADYINLKNSGEKEKAEISRYAKEGLFHDLIGLADSFELAFANKESWLSAPENWRKGIEYIYSNLTGAMESHGLKEINPQGQKFNPAEHQPIATIEVKTENEDDLVLEVLKKGYKYQDKVIRPAHVKVGTLKK